jgi:hypothetical protein
MTCGEYGYTFTHYLLNKSNSIEAVRELKWESIINNDATGYTHILSEHFYDFRTDIPAFYLRKDTMDIHFLQMDQYPDSVALQFRKESFADYQEIHERLSLQLANSWKRTLVE